MLADTYNHRLPTIIWAGRNNYSSPATVKSDIASMVASLGHSRYLIVGITNADQAVEWSGGSDYAQIVQLNADLATLYGSRFIDIRSYLVSLYNPASAQDVIDHGHDVPPSSLRSDGSHPNNAGYQAIASKLYESISILAP